jgi:hypothetical protein
VTKKRAKRFFVIIPPYYIEARLGTHRFQRADMARRIFRIPYLFGHSLIATRTFDKQMRAWELPFELVNIVGHVRTLEAMRTQACTS